MIRPDRQPDESFELQHNDEYLDRSSFDDPGARAQLLNEAESSYPRQSTLKSRLLTFLPFIGKRRHGKLSRSIGSGRGRWSPRFSVARNVVAIFSVALLALIAVTAVLFPSYSNPPIRYANLRNRCQASISPGAGNPDGQKVFIAASIFDRGGDLASGTWGRNVLDLIYLLGPQNVYLSLYENDAGPEAEAALRAFEKKVQCENTVRFDEHLSLDEVDHVTLPDGSSRVKRIAYLAEARNRALLPMRRTSTQYDKLLYLNDVVFDPVEAAQLLFLTGANDSGQTSYRAACAVDFINPVKYYDTFATRDYEGYGVGLPFFPWYTTAGQGISRRDVLANSDAVRVRSCWGGMAAFDARFFQSQADPSTIPATAASQGSSNISAPYRFRAESDLFWDASECCLIHADIQNPNKEDSGIYVNPYIRVAYDYRTLTWLAFTRRFERIYTPLHLVLTKLVGMPWYNPRRDEQPGREYIEEVWIPEAGGSGGSFQQITRVASHSSFCGRRALQVMKLDASKGGRPWEFVPIPSTTIL